jgi:AcrR family transcriptional regulator
MKRVGVNRLTVYNHFPDITDLLKACSRSWTERHPAPDPTPWAQIGDPQRRLRRALAELYGFYARTEPMRGNVLRDAETMPELAAQLEGSVVPYLGAVRDLLAEPEHPRVSHRAMPQNPSADSFETKFTIATLLGSDAPGADVRYDTCARSHRAR